MFKYTPGMITPDGQKVPLLKGWQDRISNDPEVLKQWVDAYGSNPNFRWIIPTGKENGLLVLDLDAKENAVENIKLLGLEIPRTKWQQTLNGGYHFFFKYPNDGKHYGNKVKIKFKELQGRKSGIDTRGEGGYIMLYNMAGEDLPLADAPKWLIDCYSQVDIPEYQGSPVVFDTAIATEKLLKALDAVREAPPGESNNTLFIQSCSVGQLVASGAISYETAYAKLYEAAIARGKPPYEAQETIKSGLKNGSSKPATVNFPEFSQLLGNFPIPSPPEPPARWTPKPISFEGLKDRTKLRQPQLFEHWSTQDITLTVADGGTGKTTLFLYEAVCGALGERFLGFECKRPGYKTLFITGEDTEQKLTSMIGMMLEQLNVINDPEKVKRVIDCIRIKKDSELCLVSKTREQFYIASQTALTKVQDAIDDFKPDVIVFDPIASFWGSESGLNDMAKAVTTFMSKLAERGIATHMINHMGKTSSSGKDDSQFSGRGGTGLPSHSRIVRSLHPLREQEFYEYTGEHIDDDHSAILCNVAKFTDGSPLKNKPFIIMRKGYLFTKRDLTPVQQLEAMTKRTDAERIIEFIKTIRSQGKFPSLEYIVSAFVADKDKISKERVRRAIEVLKVDGYMGEFVKQIEHPDATVTQKVFTLVDKDGKDI